ncbi:MAG: tRNA lysidine(34) synthetase TilS [Gammaproteobacteria bacterium]|nr:tRNA lysidine(34) synthetase TilS [Gammaproteobacteria bacterium]
MPAKSVRGHEEPQQALRQFLDTVPRTRRVLIGYSGGLDSHVLLHAVCACRDYRPDLELLALHVDHGMQSASGDWGNHCRNICRELDIPIEILPTSVAADSGKGPEASARIARYEQFAAKMRDSDYLLLAQHADDQAETFLLQALRGSGPDGLASIPRKRSFSGGWLCRPLLGLARERLADYAAFHDLRWIEDPSNDDVNLDRNFLRHEVLPLLQQRWPSLNQTLARSASRCGAASQLLKSLAQEDLALVSHADKQSLDIPMLLSLGQERVFNVLRLWVREAGYVLPRLQDLRQVESALLQARADSAGVVQVTNYEFRRFRQSLYLLPPQTEVEAFVYEWLPPYDDLSLPALNLTLTRAACAAQGLELPQAEPIRVQSRAGGELIRIGDPAFHKSVKKLLQESGIPPWRRDRLPLLYIGGRLAAVWQVIVANDFKLETHKVSAV